MKLVLVFAIVAIYFAHGLLTEEEINNQWNDYKVKFNKSYPNATEENLRKEIFSKNLQRIQDHNEKFEQGLVTYKQGVNQFSDLTEEEKHPYTHGIQRP